MYKLLYIGKSNKKFTHNHLYMFEGSTFLGTSTKNVTIRKMKLKRLNKEN